jgi:hypothetical protein
MWSSSAVDMMRDHGQTDDAGVRGARVPPCPLKVNRLHLARTLRRFANASFGWFG